MIIVSFSSTKLVKIPIILIIVLPNKGTIKINARSKTSIIPRSKDLTILLTLTLLSILNTVII